MGAEYGVVEQGFDDQETINGNYPGRDKGTAAVYEAGMSDFVKKKPGFIGFAGTEGIAGRTPVWAVDV